MPRELGKMARVAAASRCFSVPSRRHLGCRWLAASLPHRVGTRRHHGCISVIGRRPRRRWVARSCAVWRAIRRAHGDGAVAVRQLWRWRRRWRRCCFFPIASHSLLFCAGARRLLVALEVSFARCKRDVMCRDVEMFDPSVRPRGTQVWFETFTHHCAPAALARQVAIAPALCPRRQRLRRIGLKQASGAVVRGIKL